MKSLNINRVFWHSALALAVCAALAACGGGNSSSDGGNFTAGGTGVGIGSSQLDAAKAAITASAVSRVEVPATDPIHSAGLSPALTHDQMAFERVNLSGGEFTLHWTFPYLGGTLVSGTNYIVGDNQGILAASPALAGPQLQVANRLNLDQTLQMPVPVNPAHYLVNGTIESGPTPAVRRVRYSPHAILVDVLGSDQTTVLASEVLTQYDVTPLTGTMAASPPTVQSAVPLANWVAGNNLSPVASWIPGSASVTHHAKRKGDSITVWDCALRGHPTATGGVSPSPCLSGSLASIFPAALVDGKGRLHEIDQLADGTLTTVQGLPMWIAAQPLPLGFEPTASYRVYFELAGNVYSGLLERDGTELAYAQPDGTVVDYEMTFNQAAVDSITGGLTSGNQSQALAPAAPAQIATLDLFGLGGHAVDGALAPADLALHYQLPAAWDGSGQTIAIVNWPATGYPSDDLVAFSSYYGLPICSLQNGCLRRIDLSNGAPVDPSHDATNEVAIDLQGAHAAAPGAKLVLVTAASRSFTDLLAAIETAAALPGVGVVSVSYGYAAVGSQSAQQADAAFQQLQAQYGTIIFASSGDYGFVDASQYPAASPAVTAVGGTRITAIGSSNKAPGEVAWSFSGGGSNQYTASVPTWQASALSGALINATGNHRLYPDVSAVADDSHSAFAIYHTGQWLRQGGTSLATPIWAGIAARTGQYLISQGKSLPALVKATPGGFNGLLYQSRVVSGGGFFDITSGSNDVGFKSANLQTCPPIECAAAIGYDPVTGLGSVNASALMGLF